MFHTTNAISGSKLAPIPARSRAGMRARCRAHKKKLSRHCLGRDFNWISSTCSSTIRKISSYLRTFTLNKVAGAIVVASYLGGMAYALNNSTSSSVQQDMSEGAALAIGASMATCCATAAIQHMRGKSKEAKIWKYAALASTLPAALLFLPQISKIYASKAEIPNPEIDYQNWAGECQSVDMPSIRVNSLECFLLEGAKSYIDQNTVTRLERSKEGAGGVYFPPDVSVVIKHDHPGVNKNVLKIEEAKKICLENNYHHLTIPKASFYKDHSIHSLLPIPKFHRLMHMELYLENKHLFTDAVREFAGLLCQAHLNDIIGIDKFYGQSYWPRQDNVRIYLEKKIEKTIGKIALVDLDHFSLASNDHDFSDQVHAVIRFFPYHFEEILEEAKKFYPNIENQRTALEAVRNEAIDAYQNVYGKHVTFLKTKGVSFSNPDEVFSITEEAKKHVKNSVAFELKNKINNYESTNDKYHYFFIHVKDQREVSFNIMEKVLPEIIDLSVAFIENKLKEKFLSNKFKINSQAELLALRTLSFSICDNSFSELEQSIRVYLTELPEHARIGVGEYLAITVFKKLQEVGYNANTIDAHKVILFC